ncbi:MAG: di-trans,poly-cis-decaprenylcistransferase [Simkaniaceae bacterium]|nr:di-trans,poly-cis-decaprenylcistransferase [Simkaniaceae bacterium]
MHPCGSKHRKEVTEVIEAQVCYYPPYSDLEQVVDLESVPKHIAILMDGNRRWAKMRGRPSRYGHWKGASVVSDIVEVATDLGIETMTLYTFSTENWKRSAYEIHALMYILESYLLKMRKKMLQNGVRFETIGDLTPFPMNLQLVIKEIKQATQHGSQMNLVLALNYGSRDELRRATIKACQAIQEQGLSVEALTEELISQCLDTAPFGDPELIIRTGGMERLSNFLLWQASYSEFYTTPVLWPDFNREHFISAVVNFQNRQRRLGI